MTVSAPALAQFGVGVGLKAGIPFTNLLETTGTSSGIPVSSVSRSSGYLIGPTGELRLPLGLAFEVDAIYNSSDYQFHTPSSTLTTTASAWEIPYLGKFRFPIPLLKPFITAGGAYRTFTNLPSGTTATHNGFVLGGGLELRVIRLRVSAEVRYLHWDTSSINTIAKLGPNQGELLFGITF